MVYGYRYIQIDETGMVSGACADPVFVDGVEITIDTEGIMIPEKPTDAIYELYYNETDGLHWVKQGEFNTEPVDTEILLCETLSVAEYNSCLLEMMM